MQRVYRIPEFWNDHLNQALKELNTSLYDSKNLAQSVLQLSDYFIANPESTTPWEQNWAQIAYLAYYLPLNASRILSIRDEALRIGFFDSIESVVDFGAGLATASLILSEKSQMEFTLIEQARQPQSIIEKHFAFLKAKTWLRTIDRKTIKLPTKTLGVFSYSLTELEELPDWAFDCEALMIVEPSTEKDGRKLMKLREKLLTLGYHVWAPCTHENSCPLLNESKHDWCHDRIYFDAPSWFLQMEEHLPMKNRTLTMSYLLVRKTKPKQVEKARVVGDLLLEKGKDRQLICRGPQREFLSWMHKNKLRQEIPRGVLIEIPEAAEKISNEIRVKSPIKF